MSDRRTSSASNPGPTGSPESAELLPCRVAVPAAFLYSAPGGRRDRQMLFGDHIDVTDERDGWSLGRAAKDGYVGWLKTFDLGPDFRPTHAVRARHLHVYPRPDMKLPPVMRLPFGARVAVEGGEGRWAETPGGWVHADHLRALDAPMRDPVAVAEMFLGAPYLWAGNTGDGIDCSGLVQVSCHACGITCPADSGQQAAALGTELQEGADPRRGDLLFWKGHVVWVADPETVLHATAFRMAVVYEPLRSAIERIEAQGEGPVTSHRRLVEAGAG